MRRALLLASLVLVFIVGISVVSAQDTLATVDPSGQTVVYWHQFQNDSAQGNTIAAIIDDFNKTNQYGITVQGSFQGNYTDLGNLINAGITSGDLPNLAAGYANAAASYFLDKSAVDLGPYINSTKWGLGDMAKDFRTDLIDFNTISGDPFNGAVVAWPHQFSAQVFAYNSTLLKTLGFDAPPTTIDDFKTQACAASKAKTADGNQIQGFPITTDASAFESWVASMGGAIYHDGKYDFSSDAVKGALQLYQDMYSQGCAYIPGQQYGDQTDFNNGVVPFYVTSSAGFTYVISGFQKSGVTADWSVQTFPHTEGNQIIQVFEPSIILMPSTPEKQLASWLFLKYLDTPEVAAKWSEGTGYFNPVPSTADMLSSGTFTADGLAPYFNAANALLSQDGVKLYSSPAISSYGAVRNAISTAIADVTSNNKPVADVMTTLQKAADDALAGK